MKKRRFLSFVMVLALALTLIPAVALPALAIPVSEVVDNAKNYVETVGVKFMEPFKMIYVEGGSFTLGWEGPDGVSAPPDSAAVSASVDSYWICETEVTNNLWRAVMGTDVPLGLEEAAPPFEYGGDYPKIFINFYDVNIFLGRLYVLTGKVYRMATEAEWEFAAKGGLPGQALGHNKLIYAGSNVEEDVAYIDHETTMFAAPTHVKSKQPNILGIYDMSGNVEEWVWDAWSTTHTSGHNPVGIDSPIQAQRTRRGGTSGLDSFTRYASARQIRTIDGADGTLGFRFVLSEDQESVPWYPLPAPFEIRKPTNDDWQQTPTYRDPRWITGDDYVWKGDFMGISSSAATMKLWEDGTMRFVPGSGTAINGQWYTVNGLALILCSGTNFATKKTITYCFIEDGSMTVQNNDTSVFTAPTGRFLKQREAELGTTVIAKPTVANLTPTNQLRAGVGIVAANHQLWDMDNIPEEAKGQDPRLLDGPNHGWWMGRGGSAGGEHTYRQDIDPDMFRFIVYVPNVWSNMLTAGNWYTVNDMLLRVYADIPNMFTGELETRYNDYIYHIISGSPTDDPYSSSSNFPFRQLTLQDYERGDSRLFYRNSNALIQETKITDAEGNLCPNEIPKDTPTILGDSTFRQNLSVMTPCPGIPVPGGNPNWKTCGGTVYTCTCPIHLRDNANTKVINAVALTMPQPVSGGTNNAAARTVAITTPAEGVTAYVTAAPFTPVVANGGTFAANTAYKVLVTLTPHTGYEFPASLGDLAVTVNGSIAGTVTSTAGVVGKGRNVEFTFTPPVTTTINAVDLFVPNLPAVGLINNDTARLVTTTTAGVNPTTTATPFGSGTNYGTTLAANAGFAANTTYRITITVNALTGYVFPTAAASVTATVNGTTTNVAVSGTGTASKTVTFVLPATGPATEADYVEISMPPLGPWAINNAATRTLTVTGGAGVATVATAPSTFTPTVAANAIFAIGESYTTTFTLAPGTGRTFPATLSSLVVKVNDVFATVTSVAGTGNANRNVSVTFAPITATQVDVVNLALPAPAAGGLNDAAAKDATSNTAGATVTTTFTAWTPTVTNFTSGTPTDAMRFGYGVAYTTGAITLTPQVGYYFSATPSGLTVLVNGQPYASTPAIPSAAPNTRTVTVAFPQTAQGTPINSIVDVSIPAPAIGKSNDAAARTVTTAAVGVSPSVTTTPFAIGPAFTSNVTSGGTFAAGTVYRVTITLTASFGYAFPADFAATVNGQAATVTGTGNTRTVTYVFPATATPTSISSVVNVTIPAPTLGMANDDAARVVATTAAGVTPSVTTTPFAIGPAFTSTVASGNAFAANTEYRVTITLTAGTTYAFPDGFAATVNGQPATVTGSGSTRTVTYTFAQTGAMTEINNIALTMRTPIPYAPNDADARTITAVGGPAIATATAATTPWNPTVTAASGTLTNAMKFQPGTTYTFSFTLNQGRAYTLPASNANLTVTVNGITATITGTGATSRSGTVVFPVPKSDQFLTARNLNRVVGDGGFNLNNYAGSSAYSAGGTIVYTVAYAGRTGARISGTTLSYTAKGAATITASTVGNGLFNPAATTFTLFVDYPQVAGKAVVEFDVDGVVTPVTVDMGATVAKPADPTKDEYTFTCWTLNGAEFDFSTPIEGNITLVANWTNTVVVIDTAIVEFDVDGVVTPVTVTVGETVAKPSDPAKDDYIFDCWTLNDVEFDFDTPITEDITLVAKWIPIVIVDTAIVEFIADGVSTTAMVPVGETVAEPANPQKDGHSFICWTLNDAEFDFSTPIMENITLVAKWKTIVTSVKIISSTGVVLPAMYTISRNSSVQLVMYVNNGVEPVNVPLTWIITDTSYASIDANGRLTTKNKVGTTTLTAKVDNVTATIVLRIT